MKRLAPENPALAARLELFEHRVREEFYDYDNDPDALHNLIDDPKFANEVRQHRQLMEQFMSRTSDPALEAFRHRDDEAAVQAWMSAQEAASQARRAQRRQRKQNPQPRQKKPRRQLISLKPKPPMSGTTFTVIVSATLPAELGQQQCHVTLKSGKDARRLDRKVITIGGTAETSVTFTVPEDAVRDGVILFSAFVGDDYQHNLQHVTTAPVRVASGGQKPTGKPH